MPRVSVIAPDDVAIAAENMEGFPADRCNAGLWGVYNVIARIIAASGGDTYKKVLECLYMIGVHAAFDDGEVPALVYTGKTNKKYKRNMPASKYLFELEKHGFAFRDIVSDKTNVPHKKLPVKDIARFSLVYTAADYQDVVLGLKLFSDVCVRQSGDCFYTGDIRVAFTNAPKLYAPPVDEVYDFLPPSQRQLAYAIHDKLEALGCVRNLEREYMTRYIHPRNKGKSFATIYAAEHLYFLPKDDIQQQLSVKLNLRNIGKYDRYLSDCTESIRQSVLDAPDCTLCAACGKKDGGIAFAYRDTMYRKCTWHCFRFSDLSEDATIHYQKLIELEDEQLREGPRS